MTMINGLVQGRRAYIYGDTACVNMSTGAVEYFFSKLLVGQHFPWAAGLTQNGSLQDLSNVISADEPKNVRGLLRALPGWIIECERLAVDRGWDVPITRLTIAMWDARLQKPRLVMIGSEGANVATLAAPMEIVELDYIFPGEHSGMEELIGREANPRKRSEFDPDVDAITVAETQRRKPFPMCPGGPLGHWIGGHLEQAIVTKDGVKVYRLHKWDDREGEPIRPRRLANMTTEGAGN